MEAPVAVAGGAFERVGAAGHELAAAVEDVTAIAGRVVSKAFSIFCSWKIGCELL